MAHLRINKIAKALTRHRYAMVIAIAIITLTSGGFLYLSIGRDSPEDGSSRIIVLNVDRSVKSLPTREETVGGFLNKAGVIINSGDVVEPSLDTKIEEDNFRINVYRAAPVVVIDGNLKSYGLSAALTPRSMAEQVGAKLYPEDNVVSEPSDDFLRDISIANKIVIDRASPAALNLYGKSLKIRTQAKTVDELLTEKNIQLAHGDTVMPARSKPVRPGLQIFVIRKGTKVVTKEVAIEPPVQTIDDASLSFGTTAVRQQGKAGKKSVTYQIKTKNGRETSRSIIQQVIISKPVTQIVARGRAVAISGDKTSWMAGAGISKSDYPFVNYIISRESGWCPTKWQGQIGYCPAYYTEAHDPSSGFGFGLCQSTPAIKMASAGSNWRTSAVTQMKWCSGYATSRYGSWEAAYNFWSNNHWW